MPETALRWSGLLLIAGAAVLATAIVRISFSPMVNGPLSPSASVLLLLSSILLLLSLPGMYAKQAGSAGWLGAAGYVLLQAGVVLLVFVASTPILYPSFKEAPPDNVVAFLLGIALVVGLLLTGIATMNARVFPRGAAILILAATAGFFFDFFIAEFLPPIAGQVGSAFFGVVLGVALAWIGLVIFAGQSMAAKVMAA